MVVSNRNLLFQGSIFRCYVSFRECNYSIWSILVVTDPKKLWRRKWVNFFGEFWKRTTSTFDIGTEHSHIWKEIHFHKPSFWVSTLVFGSVNTYLSLFPLPSDSVKGVSQGAPLEIYQSYGSVRGNSALNLQGTNISPTKAFLMMICFFHYTKYVR